MIAMLDSVSGRGAGPMRRRPGVANMLAVGVTPHPHRSLGPWCLIARRDFPVGASSGPRPRRLGVAGASSLGAKHLPGTCTCSTTASWGSSGPSPNRDGAACIRTWDALLPALRSRPLRRPWPIPQARSPTRRNSRSFGMGRRLRQHPARGRRAALASLLPPTPPRCCRCWLALWPSPLSRALRCAWPGGGRGAQGRLLRATGLPIATPLWSLTQRKSPSSMRRRATRRRIASATPAISASL
mmetsp:Transcript_40722/g.86700  ORF Transcript_40722/g.86700 Transcript_40722/m.86700 type:complete len:242 (+) Transcript_40722:2311-3036(+)